MKKDGLERLLEFTALLKAKDIRFRIERQMQEALMVTFTRSDVCVEVNFLVDEMWFSFFLGAGTGEMADDILSDLLRENWGD